MFKLVPRSHLAQSFVSTFLYDGCAISSQKKNKIRKNRDRLKFSHHMHQCQTDRLWAQTQCQFLIRLFQPVIFDFISIFDNHSKKEHYFLFFAMRSHIHRIRKLTQMIEQGVNTVPI